MDENVYSCAAASSEDIEDYREGGYHPVHLGDILHNDRYRIIHKLGFGSYATVWAARDQRLERNVAIKIMVSELHQKSKELETSRIASTHLSAGTGSDHVLHLLDDFQIQGPNGIHDCLVYEVLGPNLATIIWRQYQEQHRLPARIAKRVAKEALLGLAYLHEQGIGHGDIYTNNLAFSHPDFGALSEDGFMVLFGQPSIHEVKRLDGRELESNIPQYLVSDCEYAFDCDFVEQKIKIIDYKLVTGLPPYERFSWSEQEVLHDVIFQFGELPDRWQQKWEELKKLDSDEDPEVLPPHQEFLEQCYAKGDREKEFSDESLKSLGRMLRRLLRIEPGSRDSAADVLQDPWFYEDKDEELSSSEESVLSEDSVPELTASSSDGSDKETLLTPLTPAFPESMPSIKPTSDQESQPIS
ncbi:MAG: hypothetical protein Q9227_007301 [Pyrenula ochraceoflavens]